MRKTLLVIAALLAASAAQAQESCAMNYPVFEVAIPHLDLPACPKDLARPNTFCRATAANDALHVFVFEERGSSACWP